jgi:hypothetical protein
VRGLALSDSLVALAIVGPLFVVMLSHGADHVETICDARIVLIEIAASKEINCIVRVQLVLTNLLVRAIIHPWCKRRLPRVMY